MSQETDAATSSDVVPVEDAPRPTGIAWGRFLVWGVIAALLGLMGWQLINTGQTQPTEGRAPDFTVTTYDGETYRLSDMRGQVVVVNFWASWCVPCIQEAPELEATWQTYKDQGNVMFIGIDYLDSERKGLDFLTEHGITYPNGPDLRQKIAEDYEILGVPETFIIDPQGNVSVFYMEPITQAILTREIEYALRSES